MNNNKILGISKQIKDVIEKAEKAGRGNDSPVLIMGESGTGKELVANLVHKCSNRRKEVLRAVNCAATPRDLFESIFFGYEKGAFTGAVSDKKGILEAADGGTVFLDEIGELDIYLQAKLLRFLENGTFYRLGGASKEFRSDVRIISATNSNLWEKIQEGKFRSDLYYRINVIPIYIPPLRSRTEDIDVLATHFFEKYKKQCGKEGLLLSQDVTGLLKMQKWPGNVRELQNMLRYVIEMTDNGIVTKDDIELHNSMFRRIALESGLSNSLREVLRHIELPSLSEGKRIFEKAFIEEALVLTDFNITKAAAMIEVERSNLHRKIKLHEIDDEY